MIGRVIIMDTVRHADTRSNLSEKCTWSSVIKLFFNIIINICNERLGSEFLILGGCDTGDSFWITGLIEMLVVGIIQLNGTSRKRFMNLTERRHRRDLRHLRGRAFNARQGLDVSILQRKSEITLVNVGQWRLRLRQHCRQRCGCDGWHGWHGT